jgi:carnosine N-methyltransferase
MHPDLRDAVSVLHAPQHTHGDIFMGVAPSSTAQCNDRSPIWRPTPLHLNLRWQVLARKHSTRARLQISRCAMIGEAPRTTAPRENGQSQGDEDDMQEQHHFASILRAFDEYRSWGLAKVERMERHYGRLSAADQRVTGVAEKLTGMRAAVEQNARVIARLVEQHRATVAAIGEDRRTRVAMPQPDGSTRFVSATSAAYVPESDMEKVQSTIKQFVREWGEEGRAERDSAHAPVLEALGRVLPRPEGRRILLPGAGLGRMVWDVARLGYTAQGNEFSYFMLIASNFILNVLGTAGQTVSVHPWVLHTCNNVSTADQLRAARVPHVPPDELPETANLSMCAGDFLEVR